MIQLEVFTDGGSRGNPGPAAAGIHIQDNYGNIIVEIGEYLGEQTNNYAEYQALLIACQWLDENLPSEATKLTFYLDSELVVKQINGDYKIKNENLKEIATNIFKLIKGFEIEVEIKHIPRKDNHKADALVNQSLDKFIKSS